MESLANAVCLRVPYLCFGVVNVVNSKVQLIVVLFYFRNTLSLFQ